MNEAVLLQSVGSSYKLIAFQTIVIKEVRRWLRIWIQTLVPPVITIALYFVIFGNLIGNRIGPMNGYTYMEFIVPGLIMMAVINNSFANVVSSFFSQKFQRSIEELLVSPVPDHIILLGFVVGGVARGLAVGLIASIIALFFSGVHMHNIFITALVVLLASVVFSLGGFINAVYANKFDDISIVPTFFLTPLIYLGGVFYSVDLLPPFWKAASHFNPIFYMVDAFRYGILGISDANIWLSIGLLLTLTATLFALALVLLRRGKRAAALMQENPLGRAVRYPEHYDPQLLLALPREVNRKLLGINSAALPFCGADIWNAFELSWLNPAGKPQAGRGRFIFPCTSPNLIESKSLKLYLNSLNQHRFSDFDAARNCIRQDLATAAGAAVDVLVQPFSGMKEFLDVPEGTCLDRLNIGCEQFETDAELLFLAGEGDLFAAVVDEIVYTDLFRSRCPITGQPDWATLTVCYNGPQIDHAALFRYLISYRMHADYHENCVERIFCDIMQRCRPQALSVEANFLRRGGLDINPVRSTTETMDYVLFPRFNRQ